MDAVFLFEILHERRFEDHSPSTIFPWTPGRSGCREPVTMRCGGVWPKAPRFMSFRNFRVFVIGIRIGTAFKEF